jgi:hypothetical protein
MKSAHLSETHIFLLGLGQTVFRGEESKKSANQKQESPMAAKNPEIRLRFHVFSDFNNRRLTVAILTLSDKPLIETDLLKTGFLFEFSSFS